MKTFTLALATTLVAVAASAQTTLSLNEAIALGLEHNRAVATASLQVDKAEQDLATARTRRLPSFKIQSQASQLLRPINVSFAQGAFGTFPGIGPVPATDTNITTPAKLSFLVDAQAQQPLTQLFKINLNVKLNEATREYQREQLRDARLSIVGEIKRTYYAIVQTQAARDANLQTLTLLRELDRVVALRMAQQVALKADGLSVKTRIANADLAEITYRHALASQKEQLNQLIGRDVRTAFEVTDVPETTLEELDLAAAQGRALDARPDVRQARIKVEQAELARRIAKTDYLPEAGLTFSYLSPINISGAPRQIATAAVQVEWEPFDWGRKSRALATKDIEIRQARNAARDAEDRAVLELNARFRNLEQARAQLHAATLDQEASRENARVRTNQYEVRAALLADVLQTQAAVADSDSKYQQALSAFWTARADFERALGGDIQ